MEKKPDFARQQEEFLKEFNLCRPVLSAMGDENRQLILRVLIQHCPCGGLRVGEIQSNTNISRAAVSHHLKVLREAGVIKVRQEGTKNYYYMDAESNSMKSVAKFWQDAVKMADFCPLHRKKESLK